jgi:hypothetical protein
MPRNADEVLTYLLCAFASLRDMNGSRKDAKAQRAAADLRVSKIFAPREEIQRLWYEKDLDCRERNRPVRVFRVLPWLRLRRASHPRYPRYPWSLGMRLSRAASSVSLR